MIRKRQERTPIDTLSPWQDWEIPISLSRTA